MYQTRRLCLAVWLLASLLQTHGADKYTDENRPYEFGFNIEGEQHRHEKKDENGLIMGEFGFITADGVYHVTVYATDENGNFKILSMKNIRVKPYPTAPTKQGHSLKFPPSKPGEGPPPPPAPASQQNAISQLPQKPVIKIEPPPPPSPAKSCSHCSIPTTTTKAPPQLSDLAIVSKDQNPPFVNDYPNYANGPPQDRNDNTLNNQQQINSNNFENTPENLQYNIRTSDGENQLSPENNRNPKQYGQNNNNYNNNQQQDNSPTHLDRHNPQDVSVNSRSQIDADQNQRVPKPQLISAQIQTVDKNTDIYHRDPGQNEGLPPGLNKDDMLTLLYTFNYTVGFHGHHEEGYTNGAKKGYYYVTGRNGLRTRIDYTADDTGFHPKISQEVLDLLSDDVPKPETEREEKYGLKGYEFKWLYFPTNSKR